MAMPCQQVLYGNAVSAGVVWQCDVSRCCMAMRCQQVLHGNAVSADVVWQCGVS